MKNIKFISVSVRPETEIRLKELHKQSDYRSFSEWVDRVVLEPFIKIEDDRIQEEINQQKGK